jgi:hypothetical protein
MFWILIAAAVAVAVLTWNLYRRFMSDRLQQFNDRRRASSRLVSLGEFVDGNRHLAVALALTQSTFFYENSDMQASVDLEQIEEIDYDTELATGGKIPGGKVLRLRCHSQTFEFVLPDDVVPRWHLLLPPRREREAVTPATPGLAPTLA